MVGNQAIAAFGTKLLRGPLFSESSEGQYEEIAEVTNISGPQLTTDTEDATSHDQAEPIESVIATILRLGELNVDLNFVPGMHRELAEDWRGRVKRHWKIVFPDADETEWTFAGLVTQAPSPEAPVAGVLTGNVTIKVTDDIDFGGDDD